MKVAGVGLARAIRPVEAGLPRGPMGTGSKGNVGVAQRRAKDGV